MESGVLLGSCYKERVYIRSSRDALHLILVQIRVLVIPMKMAPKTVKRSTVGTQSKRKRKGSSVKRKPKGKNQKGGSSVRRKPRRKSQKGGFIFTPFTKLMDNALDYDRRQQQAKKRGKKFKKKKATDDVWQFIEKKLG